MVAGTAWRWTGRGSLKMTEQRKKEFRRDCLLLEFEDLEEIHGWLIGVAVAVERKRGVPYAEADALVKELRESSGPSWEETI